MASTERDIKSRRPSCALVAVTKLYPFSCSRFSWAGSRWMQRRVLVAMPYLYKLASCNSEPNCTQAKMGVVAGNTHSSASPNRSCLTVQSCVDALSSFSACFPFVYPRTCCRKTPNAPMPVLLLLLPLRVSLAVHQPFFDSPWLILMLFVSTLTALGPFF